MSRSVDLLLLLFAFAATPSGDQPLVRPPELITTGNIWIEHWSEQARLAARVAEIAERARMPALPADILEQPPRITLRIAPDERRFQQLTGGLAPHWGAGVAFPAQGIIVIPTQRAAVAGFDELTRIIRHELAHVALHRYLEPARIPRWFTEGYATWAAGQLDLEAAWLLRLAFVMRRAPPLDSLVLDWPAGAGDARVAYLLSASVLDFLHARGGEASLAHFLARWRGGDTMEEALFATYGLTLAMLERHWSRDVRRRYGWTVFFSQAVVIWAILGMLVIALFAIRKRRDRRRLERLRAEELPEEPAYWEGEVETARESDESDEDADDGDDEPPPAWRVDWRTR